MMTLARRVADKWASEAVALAPAKNDDLDAFEQEHGLAIPPLLRSIYLESNGTVDASVDLFHFWPIQEWTPPMAHVPKASEEEHIGMFVIADYSLWAHAYAVCPSDGKVYLVGGVSPILVAPSTESFFRAYLDCPDDLFG